VLLSFLLRPNFFPIDINIHKISHSSNFPNHLAQLRGAWRFVEIIFGGI
jgi:hypothetical protein